MQKIRTTSATQLKYGSFVKRFGRIWTLKLIGSFNQFQNLTPYQFAIHGIHGVSKEKEKQLGKTAVFRQLAFSTRES